MKQVNAKGRLLTLKVMSRHPEAPVEPPKVSSAQYIADSSFLVMDGARRLTSLPQSPTKAALQPMIRSYYLRRV